MNNIALYEKSRYTASGIRYIGVTKPDEFPVHWHEHIEIHFMISGESDVRCGSQVIHLSEKDCLIINSNELHEGINSSGGERFSFKIEPSLFDHKRYVFDNRVHDDTVTELLFKIVELHKNEDDASLFLSKGYVFQLIGYLCNNYTAKSMPPNINQQNNEKLQRMNAVVSYIHSNYATEISIGKLAQMSHYNYSHFCHTFKEVFGMSAVRYILSIRINKASALLSATDMNITEVAISNGFSDANYFARIFKRETGFSPSKYREKMKSETKILKKF